MKRALLSFALLVLAACGGNVVVDVATGGQSATTTNVTGAGAGVTGGCPTPHPEKCNSVTACPCTDGTTQVGGCPNGFTCPEACCGHGGSQ